MAEHKELMKVERAEFGFGGYQDVMLGVSWSFSGKACGCGDFWGTWASGPSSGAKWTEAGQSDEFANVVRRIGKVLKDAGRDSLSKMVGVPVEVTFDSPYGRLVSWRVLTEVL